MGSSHQPQTRVCTKCKVELPASMFGVDKRRNALTFQCKPCRARYATEHWKGLSDEEKLRRNTQNLLWRRTNPGSVARYTKKTNLKRKYGMEPEDYKRMMADQHEGCAICGTRDNYVRLGKVAALAVDHDPATGLVRGLLCNKCNTAIGLLKHDPALLANAIRYLGNGDCGAGSLATASETAVGEAGTKPGRSLALTT